jgi:hypothetical protein
MTNEHDATQQQQQQQPAATATPATLTHDKVSGLHWLEFTEKPDEQTRAALKAAGWRWGAYRKAWYSRHVVPNLPPCIDAEDGGAVEYAAERPARLEARAQRHEDAAADAYARSNAAVAHIPLGQPILSGHHSERGHRAALRRARSAMDKSVREAAAAARLHRDAERSAQHQEYAESPEAMTRRAERLEAEYRRMRRHIEEYEASRSSSNPPISESESEQREWLAYCQYAENTRRTAEQLRQDIAEQGGIAADRLQPQVGDLVRIHGFVGTITRINPKTYTVRTQRDGWISTLDKTHLTAIIQRHEAAAAAAPEPEPEPEPEQTPAAPCVWCDRLTNDPQRVCQTCRDRDNAN